MCWCYGVVRLGWCGIRMQASYQSNTTHEITQQISRKLLKMDVLTFETCWAVNSETIKQVTSSWSIFIQLSVALYLSHNEFRREINLTWESYVNYLNIPQAVSHTCASANIVKEIKSGEFQSLYYLGHISGTYPRDLCRIRSGIFVEVKRGSLAYACKSPPYAIPWWNVPFPLPW